MVQRRLHINSEGTAAEAFAKSTTEAHNITQPPVPPGLKREYITNETWEKIQHTHKLMKANQWTHEITFKGNQIGFLR